MRNLQRKQLFLAVFIAVFAVLTGGGFAGAVVIGSGDSDPVAPITRVKTVPLVKAVNPAKPAVKPSASPTEAPVPAADAPAPAPRRVAPAAPRPAAPPPAPAAPRVAHNSGGANNTALLVGINNAPGSPKLEGSITDAKNMRTALLKYGYKDQNIKLLADASRHEILTALDSLAKRTSGKGLAVFLLATHSGNSGGDLSFATGGGGRISRGELASRLGRVPGKLWSMLATCYSQGYSVPGIVGHNRIAVFSSDSGNYSYQLGSAGSWLVLYMVKRGMVERDAKSIEEAYHWAKNEIKKKSPDRMPILSDGISGDVKFAKAA
jgi:hypothetical protein